MITIPSGARSFREPDPIVLTKFGGVDYSTDPTQIADNRFADMLNIELDTSGNPQKVLGYKRAFPTVLNPAEWSSASWSTADWEGEGADDTGINMLSFNPVANKFVFAHDDKLYTFTEGNEPTVLYTGIASNVEVNTFFMNGKQFFLDGTNYLYWDGVNPVADVSTIAYVPTLNISRTYTGGGTANEQWNLIGTKFKDSFSTTATQKVYTMSLTNLSSVDSVVLNGVTLTVTTQYTVNLTTGAITLVNDPGTGTNNLIIQASKTFSGYADRIKNCKFSVLFGGQNDTRVFLSGNPNYKNYDWRSGLYDPTYFPENTFEKLGSDYTAITGYAKQYDTCLILKEDSEQDSTIYIRSFALNNGVATFPVVQGNARIGCYAKKSIQIVEDSPVFLSKKGLYRFSGSNVKDERAMQHLSTYLEPNLLDETNLQNARSFDFNGKYGLAINGNVYVLDYRNKFTDSDGYIKYEGYKWDDIKACCFLEYNSYLYFGSSEKGMVYKFNKISDTQLFENDDRAINSYIKTKIFSMDLPNWTKIIENVSFTLKALTSHSGATLKYVSDKKISDDLLNARLVYMDFADLRFDDFSFLVGDFPKNFTKKVKAKKVTYFQVILENNEKNDGMSISNITIKYNLQKENKK